MTDSLDINLRYVLRALLALALTGGLLVFLAALRLSEAPEAQTLTIHSLDRIDPVSLPEPPPPVELPPPPPPQVQEQLPELDIELESVAPAIKATTEGIDHLELPSPDFSPAADRPRERLTFASTDLDTQPKLIHRPEVTFPRSMKERGIVEGRVTLEVLITSEGNVRIRRVLESEHVEFVAMARSLASRSKFTPPQRDGRSVNAIFKLPIILRP